MARSILLTGATDGIGLALARVWAARGERLLLHGRRPADDLPPGLLEAGEYCRADLVSPDCAEEVAAFLDERLVEGLDLLVHNAGGGYYGEVGAQPTESIGSTLRVNLEAPMELTRLLLPRLIQSRGTVVFISSIAAALPCPDYAVYTASKAALEGFARALRVELEGRVSVQVIRPGPTQTGMHEKVGAGGRVPVDRFPPAQLVAGRIAHAIDRGGRRRTIGLGNRVLTSAGENLAIPIDALMRWRRK